MKPKEAVYGRLYGLGNIDWQLRQQNHMAVAPVYPILSTSTVVLFCNVRSVRNNTRIDPPKLVRLHA